jgi:hypothetical protein
MDAVAIRDALDKLKRADTKLRIFGASGHKWKLASPVAQHQLKAFEERYGIVLPDDYRTFLLEVGNGGAGPYYGLYPLGVFSDISGIDPTEAIGDLARPFPHTKAWNLDDQPDPQIDEKAYEAWTKRYFDTKWIDGAIPICHEGCNYYDLLVVTGSERGHIWVDGRSSDAGIAPAQRENTKAQRLSFLDWYQAWLDEALREGKAR